MKDLHHRNGFSSYCRVSSKHLKNATSYHQNNAKGLLVNISSSLLNVISPSKPFLNIRVSKNYAFLTIPHPKNNVRGNIRRLIPDRPSVLLIQKQFSFNRGSDTLFKIARFSPSLQNVTTSETPLLLTSFYVRRQLAVSYICRFLSIVIANDER